MRGRAELPGEAVNGKLEGHRADESADASQRTFRCPAAAIPTGPAG